MPSGVHQRWADLAAGSEHELEGPNHMVPVRLDSIRERRLLENDDSCESADFG